MRSKMATKETLEEKPSLVSPKKGDCAEALGLIFAPLKQRDGFRHGAIGAPGMGKTHGLRKVVAAALERDLVDVVLSHDVKGAEPEWHGYFCETVAHCQAAQLEQHRHAVFRGDPYNDVRCEIEDVAQLGKRLAQKERLRVLLNVGELKDALTEGGRAWTSPSTLWFSAQGRSLLACLTWTVQQPKRAPDEIWDQSTTIAMHGVRKRSVNYLRDTLELDDEMVYVLPQLARGEFAIYQPGVDWNGKVYMWPA
jgi:hypothetical protein